MKNTLETRLGIFVVLAVIAAVLILETLGGMEQFKRGRTINAMFNNVQDLKKGDRVKMAGVDIGRVSDLQLTNNKVMVSMKLDTKAMVKVDSIAKVQFTGLMGQNFVSLDFGSPNAPLAENDMVLATADQPTINDMMEKINNVASGVENLTKSFTGDKIDNLLGPFTDFLKANQGPLTATIANLQSVSSQIAQGKGTVGKLIYDDSLYNSAIHSVSNLQEVAFDVRLTLSEARKVVDQVNSGKGTMGLLLKDETLYRETTASVTTMREILQKINQGQGSVGKLINDPDLYKNAKMTMQKLDKATEGLEDQGPLSIMGVLVNGLF
jgi:phospholipid/cholesterol/gamma-HCH transport system substrate-binding protein